MCHVDSNRTCHAGLRADEATLFAMKVPAHFGDGLLLSALGRFGEALQQEQRASDCDPLNPWIVNSIATIHFFRRGPDRIVR